jgi:phospholipid/cholesterol/gamma-HCH transport system permease protein
MDLRLLNFRGPRGWIEALGLAALALASCLVFYGRVLVGRARFDLPAFAAALQQSGLSILPAITLVMIAIGLILGHQVEGILTQFDLPVVVILTVAFVIIIEVLPVLVGILVAGRAGVALAVRQATLLATGEMDGLLVCGIEPLPFTLAPVLLAMLLMSFAFLVWGTLVTFAVAGVWLWASTGVAPSLFLEMLTSALTPGTLIEALVKPLLFAVLIALVATLNGIGAGRRPGGVAGAATGTMIGAVTAILVTDLLYIVLVRV